MATYEFRIGNRMERFTYAEKVEADSLVEAIWLLRNSTLGWSYHYIMSAALYHVTESFFNYPQFSDYTRVATPTFCGLNVIMLHILKS